MLLSNNAHGHIVQGCPICGVRLFVALSNVLSCATQSTGRHAQEHARRLYLPGRVPKQRAHCQMRTCQMTRLR